MESFSEQIKKFRQNNIQHIQNKCILTDAEEAWQNSDILEQKMKNQATKGITRTFLDLTTRFKKHSILQIKQLHSQMSERGNYHMTRVCLEVLKYKYEQVLLKQKWPI